MQGGGNGVDGVMEEMVWFDGGLSLMDEGWLSVVGVAGWVLLSMGGHLWVGSGHPQVGAVTHGWVAIICDGRLLFVGVRSSFVVGDCCLWTGVVVCSGVLLFMGGGWPFVVISMWGVVVLRGWLLSMCGMLLSVGGSLLSIGGAWSSVDGELLSMGAGSSSSVDCCR